VTTLNNATLDRFADIAEDHDTIGPLERYIHSAAVSGWDIGIDYGLIEDVVATDIANGRDAALEFLDQIAGCIDYRGRNWQVAAYEAWRRMDWPGRPNAQRIDGVEATDSHLLTLAHRISMLSLADYRDIDYSRWRDGWGSGWQSMQPIADAVLAAHAADDDTACEDLIDILTSAMEAGAVEPPRIRRRREFGTLGFAGGLGAVLGEVV
jgi:hypothetical protein